MSQLFLRADELANIIYDVKLLISEWKVLFAIDGEMDSIQLSDFLELDKDVVEEAIKNLNNLHLIKVIEKDLTTEEVQPKAEEISEIEVPPEEVKELAEEIEEERVADEVEIQEGPTDGEQDDLGLDLRPHVDEQEDELAEEISPKEEEEIDFELPADELEESKPETGEEKEISQTEETKEESEEDLDELINDLLKEDSEETIEDESPVSPKLEEDKIEAKSEQEEPVVQEEQEDFDLGEIFETDLEETEQSLDEMLDTIDTRTDFDVEKEKEVLPPEAEEVSQKTILVVDDSVVIRKMVEIALENENYNIVSVANGKDALSFLDEKEPNMVILDIMLPDVNGLDILKAIRASKDIPVVMLSAKDTPRETSKAKELGANDFIPKPFKDEELISKIHELIGE